MPFGGRLRGRPVPRPTGLWPEGTVLTLSQGRLEYRAGEPWFVFTDQPAGLKTQTELRVLPNSRLHQLQEYRAASANELDLRIVGEITEYKDDNYLLLRQVQLVGPAQAAPPAPAQGDARDVIDLIVGDMRPVRPLPDLAAPQPDSPQVSDSAAPPWGSGPWGEGTRQVGRAGRLARQGNSWILVFESESEVPAEPAVQLLPNLALQSMEQLASAGPSHLTFTVTGDITVYAGRNFMLVRRFAPRSEETNLR
jgi:hypothetical protein